MVWGDLSRDNPGYRRDAEQTPVKNFGKSNCGRPQGLSKCFRAPIYRAHLAVIFTVGSSAFLFIIDQAWHHSDFSVHFPLSFDIRLGTMSLMLQIVVKRFSLRCNDVICYDQGAMGRSFGVICRWTILVIVEMRRPPGSTTHDASLPLNQHLPGELPPPMTSPRRNITRPVRRRFHAGRRRPVTPVLPRRRRRHPRRRCRSVTLPLGPFGRTRSSRRRR